MKGYSQGALLSRTILQAYPEHNVHNFISLSGPQAGQYGSKKLTLIYLKLILFIHFSKLFIHNFSWFST